LYYDKTVSRKVTAAFAKNVIALAESGDKTAENIVRNEAKMLSETVVSLLVNSEKNIPIGLWGGIFQHNKYFSNVFINYLSECNFSNVKLINFTPEIGAIFACIKSEQAKVLDSIKENISSTYKQS
jgi:N-acetylglucosamine kinase-like BadF-type ATPase